MRVTFEGTIHEVLDQMEEFAKSIVDGWSKPIPQPKPKKAKVEIEQPSPEPACPVPDDSDPVPVSPTELEAAPEDLLAATMGLVNGDKEKKKRLVEILGSYDAKTINALAPEYRAEFWAKVQDL
jgi:hypothetical protein